MTNALPHSSVADLPPRVGLIALQRDESIEADMRRLLPAELELFVTRVPSAPFITRETLAAMERDLTGAAALLPDARKFRAIGYGCTSGTAQIGVGRIAELALAGAPAEAVTEPVSALLAACRKIGVSRLALLSPYVEEVSGRLRHILSENGISTPVFGSFNVGEEARVARIDAASIRSAAENLVREAGTPIDGVFISCTNLRTLDILAPLEAKLDIPALSSNAVLGWRLAELAGQRISAPGRLAA